MGCEEGEIKVRSHPLAEERRRNTSLHDFDGPVSNLQGTNTKKDIEQCSRSTFSVSDGSGNVFGHYLEASWKSWRNRWHIFSVHAGQNDWSFQIVTIAEGRMSWNWVQISHTTKTEKWWQYWRHCGTSWKGTYMVTHWPACFGKERLKTCHLNGELENTWECLYVHRRHGLFLWVYVHDKKWFKRSRTWVPCDRIQQKESDLEDPTPLRYQVCWSCTKREQNLIPKRFRTQLSCSKSYRRQGRLTNKDQTKENIRWKRSLPGAMVLWKVMPKHASRGTAN